jgi:uncharacterized protein YggT (Ycf19 family)
MIPAIVLFSLVPYPLDRILSSLARFYVMLIFAWAILSWFRRDKGFISDLYRILDRVVDPYVSLFRRFIPVAGGMDFSPLVAIIVLEVVFRLLV